MLADTSVRIECFFLVHDDRHFLKQNAVGSLNLSETFYSQIQPTFLHLLFFRLHDEVAITIGRLEGDLGPCFFQFLKMHLLLVVVPLARENAIS